MNETDTQVIAWDFVEAHYPNYSSSDEIARNGDLSKLSEGEYDEGDAAHQLLTSDYGDDLKNPQIEIDLKASTCAIYEAAIKAQAEDDSAWGFAGKFLTGYTNSSDVSLSDDLQKIIDGDDDGEDYASEILRDEYDGNRNDPQILIRMTELNLEIFEGAIEGFLEEQAATPVKEHPNTNTHVKVGNWTLDIKHSDKTFMVKHSSGTKVHDCDADIGEDDSSAFRFTSDSIEEAYKKFGEGLTIVTDSFKSADESVEAIVDEDEHLTIWIRGEYTWKWQDLLKKLIDAGFTAKRDCNGCEFYSHQAGIAVRATDHEWLIKSKLSAAKSFNKDAALQLT